MTTPGVYIEGLRETSRALEAAGVEVDELKDVMGSIAAEAADTMRGFIPEKSGRAKNSIRPNRAKGAAIVTLGGARVPYINVLRYGWAARNISPNPFIERTDAVMETRAVEQLEAGWGAIAERHGLA